MTDSERKETISALRQLLAMCDFVDQYGDSIDADPYFNAVETVIELLNEMKTGYVETVSDGNPLTPTVWSVCSECKKPIDLWDRYCRSCGASMQPKLQGTHFDSVIIDECAMKGADGEV